MEGFGEFMIPKEALEKIKDPAALRRSIEDGMSLQEIFGFNEETMEKFYGAAYSLFDQKNYHEAAHAFVFLTMLSPYTANYWLGLGMSEQLIEEYEAALTAYAMSIMLNQNNPVPYVHSAKCLFALGEDEKAIASLEQAVDISGDLEEHQALKKQAKAVIKARKKKSK